MPSFASFFLIDGLRVGSLEPRAKRRELEAAAPDLPTLDFELSTLDRWRSLREHQHRVRLDQSTPRQRRDADRGTRRIRLVEISSHDLVHSDEMREIG